MLMTCFYVTWRPTASLPEKQHDPESERLGHTDHSLMNENSDLQYESMSNNKSFHLHPVYNQL